MRAAERTRLRAVKLAELLKGARSLLVVMQDNPDMIGEVADLLLRDEDIIWTMCSGFYQGRLLISIRSLDENGRADKIVRSVVARKGAGGGHHSYAGGQIPLPEGTEAERRNLLKLIQRRFLKAVGADDKESSRLV
jgi:nanoRNase/pAp phosphatase (c-di-AMP/oligoRNAs hydrolase)